MARVFTHNQGTKMDRNILKEGSTYAGLALVLNGVAAALAGDYATAAMNIVAGLAAVFHK